MSRNGLPRARAGGDGLLSGLNPEQREAVLHRDGPLLILAGAGSGKTRVICHRLASLIGGGHAAADQILAVTFTNKAAEEMRARVERLLDTAAPRLWVSTFHAFCARLLRREGPRIGLSRDFVIYDGVDQLNVVRQAMKELNVDPKMVSPRSLLSRISQAKNGLESAADLRRAGESFADEQLAEVYARYARALTSSRALDFDDLLLKTVTLFKESDEARTRYGERFRYIMVDEYQDTNRPQYLLVRYLAERHRNLCVVGDPDQSIYKWRGADLRNILDFEKDFPETTVVRLERNYRSTQVILDAASGLIAHNRRRREKRLYTESAGGDPIVFHRANDDLEEADFILGRLRDADRGAGRAAVLFRTNAQSRVIEEALGRAGIRYRVVGGVRFYERREIKDALAYLKLLLNPDDDISLRRVINVPPRGIGPGVMTGLEGIEPPPVHDAPLFDEPAGPDATGTGWSLWKRLLRATDEHLLPKRALTASSAFRTLLESPAGGRLDAVGLGDAVRRPHGERLRSGAAQGRQRGGREPPVQPDGAGFGGAGLRGAGGGAQPGRLRRCVLAAVGGRRRGGVGGRARLADDPARGQGAGVPARGAGGDGGRPVSAFPHPGRRGRPGGGAAALLRRHDAGRAAAGADQRRAAPPVRGVPVDRAVALSVRDPARVGPRDRAGVQSATTVGRVRLRRRPRGGPTAAAGAGEPIGTRAPPPSTTTRTRTSRRAASRAARGCGTRSSGSARWWASSRRRAT